MSPAKDTRECILDAALSLFYERGFEGATTRAIAERAGFNEVTLFRHFGSKEGMLAAVIRRETDITYELDEFDIHPGDDLAEDLTRMGVYMKENMVARAKLVKIIMTEASRDPGVWEHVREAPFSVLARVNAFFEEARSMGLVRDMDVNIITVAFFSFFFRTLVANAFLGQDVFLDMTEENIGEFAGIIARGISPGGA